MLKKIISEVLNPLLETISPNWIDRYGGLVQTLEVKKVIDPKNPAKTQIQKYPISCSVTQTECNDPTSLYADLVPDETKASIVYFEELSPMQFSGNLQFGSQVYKNWQKWRGKTRLVVWLNAAKLGIGVANGNYSCDWYFPYLDQLIQLLTTSGKLLSGDLANAEYTIQASKIAPKDLTIFSKYTYDKYVNYNRYPYEYFAIDFDVEVSYCVGSNSSIPSGNVIDCPFSQGLTPFINEYSLGTDAVDEYIYAANNTSLTFGDGITDDPLSITGWIIANNFGIQYILNKRETIGTIVSEYAVLIDGDDKLLFVLWSSPTDSISVKTQLGITYLTWLNIAVTYDGSGTVGGMKIYINGVEQLTTPTTRGTYTAMQQTGAAVFVAKAGWANSFYYKGRLEEFGIWRTELNLIEVQEIYNSGLPTDLNEHSKGADLELWNRFGDGDLWNGSTWTFYDNSTNSNNMIGINLEEVDVIADVPS